METTASFSKEAGMNMRWYQNLYLGPNAALNIQKIRKKAAAGKWMAGVYYITLATVPGNLLDVFHNTMLSQPLFADSQCTDIVGVAEGRREAYELVQTIVKEVYDRTGGFDIPAFFPKESFQAD